MNYLVLGVLIGASIIFYLLLLFVLLKPKYKKDFLEDALVKTDDTSFAIFSTDEIYSKYIHEYKIFKYGKYRFLTLSKSENIDYVNFDITCFKDQQFIKIINVKDTNIRKQDEYLVKLPVEATSFKVRFNQINDVVFENDNLKPLPLYKEIIYSILLGVLAVLPIVFINVTVFTSNEVENSLPQEALMNFLFDKQMYYYLIAIVFVIASILSFLILFIKNKKYVFKYKVNKIKTPKEEKKETEEEDILKELKKKKTKEKEKPEKVIKVDDYLSFYVKWFRDNKDDILYYEIIPVRKVDLVNATIVIKFLDKKGDLVTSIDKEIYKDFKKVRIKKEEEFVKCEVSIKKAVFKDFYVDEDGIIHSYQYNNKDNVEGKDLGFYGVFNTFLIYALVFFASIYGTIYTNNQVEVLKTPTSLFDYELVDEESVNGPIKITNYRGNASKVVVPSEIDGKTVVSIAEKAFADNEVIKKIAFAGEITIEKYAFSNSSLEEIDFNNVTSIGVYAFNESKLKNVSIGSSCLTIDSSAFTGISTLNSFEIVGTTSLSIGASILASSTINGDIIINRKLSTIGYYAFKAKKFNNAYVYKKSGINYSNYAAYFYRYMNYDNIYFESSCVHDSMSFMIKDDKLITKFNSTITMETEGTCVSLGTRTYHCDYCDQYYTVNTTYDLDHHNFVDGVCTWCGKVEETKEEE